MVIVQIVVIVIAKYFCPVVSKQFFCVFSHMDFVVIVSEVGDFLFIIYFESSNCFPEFTRVIVYV